tara:strand:+ start:303 stop:590 length:288 start_codon:yes stop_codon:yes gene_type:complete
MKKRTGFKMKGSPMYRNFGIGSPMRDETETETETNGDGKGIDWGKVGESAIEAGAQGLTTLAVDAMKGKPRKSRAGNTQEGFMSQKFGTDTNILV